MEENFEKYLSMLAHGNQPFVVYNDTTSYGDLNIIVATEALDEQGNKQGIISRKFFSRTDEDTGLTNICYLGETFEQNPECNNLKDLVELLTE